MVSAGLAEQKLSHMSINLWFAAAVVHQLFNICSKQFFYNRHLLLVSKREFKEIPLISSLQTFRKQIYENIIFHFDTRGRAPLLQDYNIAELLIPNKIKFYTLIKHVFLTNQSAHRIQTI